MKDPRIIRRSADGLGDERQVRCFGPLRMQTNEFGVFFIEMLLNQISHFLLTRNQTFYIVNKVYRWQ